MSASMVSGKSTRWDCDVNLWRGIPDGFPSFYGWRSATPQGPPQPPSVQDPRFFVCHHCNSYVPEVDVPHHPCWDHPVEEKEEDDKCQIENPPANVSGPTGSEASDDGYVCDWDNWRKEERGEEVAAKYVIATDENSKDGLCPLCTNRLQLEFDQDEEEWVYPGCVSVDGTAVHEECHLISLG